MKKMKRMLCVVAVIALLLSITTAVSAAMPTGASITLEQEGSNHTDDWVISNTLYRHVKGTADTHTYSIESINTSYTLDTSEIQDAYVEDVVDKFEDEGYQSSVSVPRSGYVTIPAVAVSGAYVLHLIYTHANVKWNVKIGSATIDEGEIIGAPISLSVTPVLQ